MSLQLPQVVLLKLLARFFVALAARSPSLEERKRIETLARVLRTAASATKDGNEAVSLFYRAARVLAAGEIPGVVVPPALLERAEKELEKYTHDHVDQIDKALARKEQELLEV